MAEQVTTDFILAILGSKVVEIISLQMKLAEYEKLLAALQPQPPTADTPAPMAAAPPQTAEQPPVDTP